MGDRRYTIKVNRGCEVFDHVQHMVSRYICRKSSLKRPVNLTMNPYHCPSISDYLKELVKEFYCVLCNKYVCSYWWSLLLCFLIFKTYKSAALISCGASGWKDVYSLYSFTDTLLMFIVIVYLSHSHNNAALYIFLTLFSTQHIHTTLCVYTKLRGWSQWT